MKQETGEESDKESGDLVIDDRDQSEIMDTNEVKTETEEPEEQMEDSRVQRQEPTGSNFQSRERLAFLQDNRDLQVSLLRPQQVSESNSTPPESTRTSPLMFFADVATNESKYTQWYRDSSREGSPEEVQEAPEDLTTTPRAIRPVPVTSVVTASGQPLRRLRPAGGQTIQYIPVPTASPAPVIMIQGNGVPAPQTNGSFGHVLQTNGGPGRVSHVPNGFIQQAQTPPVIRILPGGATMGMTV